MNNSNIDKFLTNLLGFKCFNITSKKQINKYNKIKFHFLLILKTFSNLKSQECKNFNIKLKSKLITFSKKISHIEQVYYGCRFAKKKDLKQILEICRENPYGSRFERDSFLDKKFLFIYRATWLKNFFKKKRGDYLIVAYKKNVILGCILLKNEMENLRIDQILVKNSFKKKGIASTLISYANNHFLKKFNSIIAGTYNHNLVAKKMYKKLNFKSNGKSKNIYHIYPKRLKL